MTTSRRLTKTIAALAFGCLLALPVAAEAQRPWGRYGPWGPYRSPFWNYYPYNEFNASARIEVTPKETEVYVDGSFAGVVDDFDGYWQRLNLIPGEHVITLYLDGYRTVRYERYFSPHSGQSIKGEMEKLTAGESSGPKPQPEPRPETSSSIQRNPRSPQDPTATPPAPAARPERFGTLALMVQPTDAQILVDGQPWTGASPSSRLAIRLSAGRHDIEVRKDGFTTYKETVLIRADATMTLNVGLTKK